MNARKVRILDAPVELIDLGAAPIADSSLAPLLPESLPARIVIKPNLCDNVSWEMGVTTDPAWIPLLARVLRQRRPDVQIQIVESDAVSAYRSHRSCDETFDRLGFREIAERENVELVNLSRQRSWQIELPGTKETLRVPELFFSDFYYISVANLKVHPYERFTGTLKNGLGLLPQSDISGYHMRLPEIICAIYRLCAPDLAIIDGRVGLEGKGPIIGDPRRVQKVIIGNDGLAVDEVACRLIGEAPKNVPHLRYAAKALGHCSRPVEVVGDASPVKFAFDPQGVHSLILAKFATRRLHRRLENASLRFVTRWHAFRKRPLKFVQSAAKRVVRQRG